MTISLFVIGLGETARTLTLCSKLRDEIVLSLDVWRLLLWTTDVAHEEFGGLHR